MILKISCGKDFIIFRAILDLFNQTSPPLHFIYLRHEQTDMAPTKLQAVPLPQPGNIFP